MIFEELRKIMIEKIPNLLYIKNETQTFNCQIKKEENKEIRVLLETFLKENPQYETLFILFTSLNQNDPLRKCLNPNCNNYLTRLKQRKGLIYCCHQCQYSSPIYKENLKKGVQEKYRG